MAPVLKKTITIEVVGSDILLLDSSNHRAYRLPLSFRETLDQLSSGSDVTDTDQLDELRDLGVLDETPSPLMTRRSVLGGAGAVAGMAVAATALPVAAAASSATFTVADEFFYWYSTEGELDYSGGFEVRAVDPEPTSVFVEGSQWTLTVDAPGATPKTATLVDLGGFLEILFLFPANNLTEGATIRATLSGDRGVSNTFTIPEGSYG